VSAMRTLSLREVSIPIPQDRRGRLAEVLAGASLELRDLQLLTKVAHWNVRGPLFSSLHPFFDTLASHLDGWVDLTAERAVTLGGYAQGTSQQISSATPLAPYPVDVSQGEAHLRALRERFRRVAEDLRKALNAAEDIGDPITVDLFTEVSRDFEKDLWMLEAHLDA
jgi:starvation-inducible DNA-binding protein